MDEKRFVIIHGPETPPDEPAYLEFYEAIGRFVLVWGRFEQHLENLQRMSLNIAARSAPGQGRMTIPLAAKLDRLCKLFPTCPELSNYLPRMNDLARLTLNLGEFRHKLIHSNFDNFEGGPPLKICLHVVSHYKDHNIKVESFRPELAHIELMIEQTTSLHRELLMPLLEDVQKHQEHRKIGRKPSVHL